MTHVLLLEDDRALTKAMMNALLGRGHAVTLATTVEEARQVYEVDRFDVLLCDYELPDGTGLDFLDRIAGSDKAVTILWSGLGREKELRESGLTVDHLLVKSATIEVLDIITAAGNR